MNIEQKALNFPGLNPKKRIRVPISSSELRVLTTRTQAKSADHRRHRKTRYKSLHIWVKKQEINSKKRQSPKHWDGNDTTLIGLN